VESGSRLMQRVTSYPGLLVQGVILGAAPLLLEFLWAWVSRGVVAVPDLALWRFLGAVVATVIAGRLVRRLTTSEYVVAFVIFMSGFGVGPAVVSMIADHL